MKNVSQHATDPHVLRKCCSYNHSRHSGGGIKKTSNPENSSPTITIYQHKNHIKVKIKEQPFSLLLCYSTRQFIFNKLSGTFWDSVCPTYQDLCKEFRQLRQTFEKKLSNSRRTAEKRKQSKEVLLKRLDFKTFLDVWLCVHPHKTPSSQGDMYAYRKGSLSDFWQSQEIYGVRTCDFPGFKAKTISWVSCLGIKHFI